MKYVVKLKEDKDIFDLGEAIKDIGIVNVSEYDNLKNTEDNWEALKQYVIDYRFNKIGSHEDGRYCVAISVSDILKIMKAFEEEN